MIIKKPFIPILIPPSVIAILFSSKVLLADTGFTGPYAPSNFTLTNSSPSGSHNGSVNTSGAPSYVSITGPDTTSNSPSTTSYTATAGYTGTYSFNWSYSTLDAPSYDYPNFINGSSVTLFSGFNNSVYGSATQSGTESYTITNGTTFGFQIYSTDNLFGAASVVISNFLWASAPASTDITVVGSPYLASDLNTTVNPTFDGGTLEMNEAVGSYAENLTLSNSATNTIDQFGNTSTFSGVFSDATTSGKISIENTGTANQGSVSFTGVNTYTGGTQVNAGANLIINSGAALGTGTLALVGSSTIPATLSTTATTTIANAITVSGDPVFNVASGTTTTVSGVISDGGSPGDVGVQGGGTLNLTNINTYTGPTTIDSGSTLALSGSGSIANSSVANSGTFNIQNVAQNVTVAGFSQASSGLLAMNFASVNNQALLVNGSTSLDGSLSLAAAAGTYVPGHYTLLTSTGLLTGHFSNVAIASLANYTNLGYSVSYDAHDVYLNLLPNLLNTQASLQANVAALQGVYALQTGTINNSLNYDCNNFGSQGFCVSTGGRYSNATESSANTTSAMVIAGYRINDQLRVGGSLDQNLYNTDVAQTAMVSSNTPLIGAFVVWNQNADRTGFEAKAATSYNNSGVTINRSPIGASELGKGSSALNTLAESLTASYGVKLGENWMTSPYAGIRHTSVASTAYTERASANLTVPLSYNGVYQDSTTALLGVKFAGLVYRNTTIQTSAGYEQDLQNSVNNYTATGLDGLTSITFNPNIQRSRAVASFGANYEVARGHNIGFNTIYRQESFQNVDTKMAYVNYTLGF